MNRQRRAEQKDISETHLQVIAPARGSETKSIKKQEDHKPKNIMGR